MSEVLKSDQLRKTLRRNPISKSLRTAIFCARFSRDINRYPKNKIRSRGIWWNMTRRDGGFIGAQAAERLGE